LVKDVCERRCGNASLLGGGKGGGKKAVGDDNVGPLPIQFSRYVISETWARYKPRPTKEVVVEHLLLHRTGLASSLKRAEGAARLLEPLLKGRRAENFNLVSSTRQNPAQARSWQNVPAGSPHYD
jgi:hypothetical protein